MIKNIEISKLNPHPKNPRKDVGDITELAESIKTNGIMQNLTVVPWYSQITGVGADNPMVQEDMGFYVVIGNRRLAAAKEAGLETLPCVIAEMDEKTQVATMLLENMQRCDLTVMEETEGIQMMFDLGSTADEISEKTGLSKSTIRRRTKLLELDREKLNQSFERGGTLQDYMELDKIKDPERKNKVLETIGTSNFAYKLKYAIDEENKEEGKQRIREILNSFASETEDTSSLRYVSYVDFTDKNFNKPEDAEEKKYFYKESWSYFGLYIEQKEAKQDTKPKADTEYQKRQERLSKLNEMSNRIFRLRFEFIKSFSNFTAKKQINIIMQYAVKSELLDYYFDNSLFQEILEIEDNDLSIESVSDSLSTVPVKVWLCSVYARLEDADEQYYDWQGNYEENETIDFLYKFLNDLGYQISDEEKAMCDGTHALFVVGA